MTDIYLNSLFDFSTLGLMSMLLSVPGIIFAFTIKGYAQAFVAKKLGDNTPERDGKLTLNPMAHIDLIGFLCILLLGIGWGKPVRTNSRNYKNVRRDNAIQIMSGPVGLIIGGFIFSFLHAICYYMPIDNVVVVYLTAIFASAMEICLSLAVFYLIPLPGLDGYNFIVNFLPYKYYRKLYTIEKYSSIIFLVFILLVKFTNLLDIIFLPATLMQFGFVSFWSIIFTPLGLL